MSTFVKLTNGDVINTQHIKSIKRHEYASAGDWARALNRDKSEEGARLKTTPSIEFQLGSNPNSLLLKYDSEQERNAEFERLEAILIGQPPILFSTLALRPELIQSIHIAWTGYSDSTLELRIKVLNMKALTIHVQPDDTDDWERAKSLIIRFGLTIPKTSQERLAERYAKEYDENGNLKSRFSAP